MRIVFDHQVFAFQKYGGISRYFVRLAERMAATPDNTVQVIAPLHVNAYLPTLPQGTARGIKLPSSLFNQRICRHVGKRLAPSLIALAKPDIVHETYYAARSSAPRGVPTVLTVYDMIHEKFPDGFAATDPTRSLKRAAVRRADHVLCISESTQRDLIEHIPEAAGKTSVTLLGFDSFGGGSAAAATGRPYLLFVGERRHYKNFTGLLRAYAASPLLRRDFGIRCFGGGPPTPAEQTLISDLGLPEGSIAFGGGDDDVLAIWYRQAVAFVYPSLYEGFGIPPLEAMSSSCPVIASDRSSIPEICGDAAAYFNPDDIESMRGVIETVVSDAGLRADLIARGHERLKVFSWDRCAEETLAAYRAMA